MAIIDKKNQTTLMDELLDEAIKTLLSRIKQVSCAECGAKAASPQDISNVLKFLKDNGFTVDPLKTTDALDDIIAEMQQVPTKKAVYPDLPN